MGVDKLLEFGVLFLAGAFGWFFKSVTIAINDLEQAKARFETKLEHYDKLATKEELCNLKERVNELISETRSCRNYSRGNNVIVERKEEK